MYHDYRASDYVDLWCVLRRQQVFALVCVSRVDFSVIPIDGGARSPRLRLVDAASEASPGIPFTKNIVTVGFIIIYYALCVISRS